MIGARFLSAMSWILVILRACSSLSEPPNTVKSLAKTNTVRPLTVPQPVTTPSPGILRLLHAEVGAAVLDEHVELLERAVIEQQVDALARGQLALGVLGGDALLAAAEARAGAAAVEPGEHLFHSDQLPEAFGVAFAHSMARPRPGMGLGLRPLRMRPEGPLSA